MRSLVLGLSVLRVLRFFIRGQGLHFKHKGFAIKRGRFAIFESKIYLHLSKTDFWCRMSPNFQLRTELWFISTRS